VLLVPFLTCLTNLLCPFCCSDRARSNQTRDEDGPEDELRPTVPKDPEEMRSPQTWDTASDNNASSLVSGSSVWSESSPGAGDRSSRRALILQMAKARMRGGGGKAGSTVDGGDHRSRATPIYEETSAVPSFGTGVTSAGNTDIDFTGELD
jgi:hypothetical protein